MSQRKYILTGAALLAGLLAHDARAERTGVVTAASAEADTTTLVAQAKSKKTKGTKGTTSTTKGKKGKSATGTTTPPAAPAAKTPPPTTSTPASAGKVPPPPPPASPAAPSQVLDLSDAKNDEAARQEVLSGNSGAKPGAQGFDFGGSATKDAKGSKAGSDFDFGEVELDMGKLQTASIENQRFEKALALMSDEKYEAAALEFRYFLDDPKFAEVQPEAQYQLAKSLYKLGFLESSLERFKQILDAGPTHSRYKKSVEWLFFISRKMADETPVLAELAKFRNVNFPKAYRNEYRYLLSKYLFIQANRFEVARVQEEELQRNKKRVQGFDFGAAQNAVESGSATFDFSSLGGGDLDFGGGDAKDTKGKGGKTTTKDTGGAFDFGATSGGTMDFGAAPAKDIKGNGLDFGSATPDPTVDGPVREGGPANAKEAIRQGLEFVSEVEPDSKFYANAKYLEGLLQYLAGADQAAVNAWQEVVRVLNPRGGARLDPKLREMAFLSLARVHYGYKQFDRAAYYYDQIDRDSENWLTALFEASWSYYQRGDFEKALGNLLTLHSPFFEREYFPESQLVKAIIYFEACRYGETRLIIDEFLERYTVVMNEIEKLAASGESGEKIFDRIAQLQAGGSEDDVTARLVSLALSDPEIRTSRAVLTQVNDQQTKLSKMSEQFRTSKVGEETRESIGKAQLAHAKEAGEVTRKKFERELYALKGLLGQALRVKLEVARSEREGIERGIRGEKSTDDKIVPAVPRTVVDDEHHYWPYEGEYWRDELGTYELDFSMCRPEGVPVAASGTGR